MVHTHCDYSPSVSELCGTDVFLKKDFAQRTGSFKERGARNALLSLTEEEKEKGVVCASAGNHSQAMVFTPTTISFIILSAFIGSYNFCIMC